MIIWLNGTFGVGKTTTASLLDERLADSRVFDPEHVGYMLSANFADREFKDFQELPPWRQLVPHALQSVSDFTGSHIIAPQTVLVRDYWLELRRGIEQNGLELIHVLLDANEDTLRSRIDNDAELGPSQWRHDHVAEYADARSWLMDLADITMDTTEMEPTQVAASILDRLCPTRSQ